MYRPEADISIEINLDDGVRADLGIKGRLTQIAQANLIRLIQALPIASAQDTPADGGDEVSDAS